ncbi:O-antigen ligase family protein [Planococcus sp. S3-L1]|uniref:O-antigen ligase family protein n=1 Tax=Planococcus sp. S3-L1 TaxID=3046200 RepID=UPI0024BB220E|nr:O-antigen ligase family protein [Planococcus sp. S3-L1]MDJ0332960.1 O-antigen ligase family protein [Planococcus sp. S3-L1]
MKATSYVVLIEYNLRWNFESQISYNYEEYMSAAYNVVIFWGILALTFIRSKNFFDLLLLLFSSYTIFIYGSRGAIFVVMILLIYLILFQTKKFSLIKFSFIGFVILLVSFKNFFLEKLINWLTLNDFNTYTVKRIVSNTIFESETRMQIYHSALDLIRVNPFGYGLGADRYLLGGEGYFSHNIFIELILSYGVVFGLVISFFIIFVGLKMIFTVKDENWSGLFALFFLSGITMLMYSGSIHENYQLIGAWGIYIAYRLRTQKRS